MSLFSGVTPIGNVPASFFTVADANGNVVQPALLTHGGDSFDLGGEVGTANTDQDPLIFGEMGNGFLGTLPNPSALIEGIYYVDDLGVAIVPTAMFQHHLIRGAGRPKLLAPSEPPHSSEVNPRLNMSTA